jgi:hypothetical protein
MIIVLIIMMMTEGVLLLNGWAPVGDVVIVISA